MDKQEASSVPVNTRVVGDAASILEGIYVLYLEDYVHTFIKKLVYEHTQSDGENARNAAIDLYGSCFEKDAQKIMVVSGAALKGQESGKYFAASGKIGTAFVGRNKDKGIRLEITVNGTIVILDDFYIYYDQNEGMQNYLIDWNSALHAPMEAKEAEGAPPRARENGGAAVVNGNVEAVGGFGWGVMNVLSLGLAACILAYGVVSLNSYEKMQGMEESIEYCMALVSENIEGVIAQSEPQTAEELVVSETEIEIESESEIIIAQSEEIATEPLEEAETQMAAEAETESAPEIESETEALSESAAEAVSVPQYYVVQRGDTLRNICIAVYGDYSRIDEVCALNGIDDPDNILYGQKLLLP